MEFSQKISDLLVKYSNLLNRDTEEKQTIIIAIKNAANISVEEKHILIKKNEIFLSISTSAKTEVFIYKEKILDLLPKNKYKNIH